MSRNALTKHGRSLILAAVAFALSACESPEDAAARQSQFDGMPLSDVIAKIGNPTYKKPNTATWYYKESHTNLTPVYRYDQHGRAILVGHNRNDVTLTCTYIASLQSGRVVQSSYDGNGCKRYAPKLQS